VEKLVLASASPRRRELLSLIGFEFDVVATDVEELTEGEPDELVVENALRKARAAAGAGEATVVGADTDVVLDGRLLGKPRDAAAARARIGALAGRTHSVISGLALLSGGRELTELVRTAVTFRALSAGEIDAYVGSGEWRGRAGGYAVQGLGSSLVAAIEGDLSNVIGLPIPALVAMIEKLQVR
jgi:nucleoside triphosphate pyrophosphatase